MPEPADRKTNFYDEILGEGNPGVEIVTAGMGTREWTMWGKSTSDEQEQGRNPIPDNQPNVEQFLFRVGKDESHAKSGVAEPDLGLWVLRAGESVAYAFTGRILSATPHSWTLEFSRENGRVAGNRS